MSCAIASRASSSSGCWIVIAVEAGLAQLGGDGRRLGGERDDDGGDRRSLGRGHAI